MYLSFYSDELDQNQITDYLTRVVQPKLTAVSGVQKADILGARTFAMRVWLKADPAGGVEYLADRSPRGARCEQLSLAVGATKGAMVSVNLTANTDLKTATEFRQLVIRERNGTVVRLQDVADVNLGAESYDDEVRFSGQKATFMGVWVLPTANSLDVIKVVRAELPLIEKELPGRHETRRALRFDEVHRRRHSRSDPHTDRDADHCRHRDLPVPRFVPGRFSSPSWRSRFR